MSWEDYSVGKWERLPAAERLETNTLVIPFVECHIYTGGLTIGGYGKIWFDGKHLRAHRFAYELEHGPIPDGMCVLHSCDRPSCVNVKHLSLGTHKDNMRQKSERGRHHETIKTHCKYGHPFDDANTRIAVNGQRACRACDRSRYRRPACDRKFPGALS